MFNNALYIVSVNLVELQH